MATTARAPIPTGFQPQVGGWLTVSFPGEILRCRVEQIIDMNRVIIEVSSMPMSRAHQYRLGDKTGARRRVDYGRDLWEALDDRDFLANRSPAEPPVSEPAVVKKAAAKRGRKK